MFRFNTIKEYHAALVAGETTCIQAVDFFLEQINQHQQLNSFLEVFLQEATSRAMELDTLRKAGKPLGKLHGVVVGIKDVLCYHGHKVTAASKILENYTAVYSATAVQSAQFVRLARAARQYRRHSLYRSQSRFGLFAAPEPFAIWRGVPPGRLPGCTMEYAKSGRLACLLCRPDPYIR